MSKRFWAIIVIIGLVFAGFLVFGGSKDNNGSAAQATNHVQGNTSSKVKLVEYGDFQCPVCGAYYPLVSQVADKYKDTIAFQFRNLPLTQVHPNAFAAARAAEAADKQGKFWEMYNLLYQNQTTWSQNPNARAQFEQYASQLGMNLAKFKADFASGSTNEAINNDIAAFKATNSKMATPSFFLNGKPIQVSELVAASGQPTLEKFSAIIDKELKKQGITPPATTPGASGEQSAPPAQ
jgi:protein-disulfide isomerase